MLHKAGVRIAEGVRRTAATVGRALSEAGARIVEAGKELWNGARAWFGRLVEGAERIRDRAAAALGGGEWEPAFAYADGRGPRGGARPAGPDSGVEVHWVATSAEGGSAVGRGRALSPEGAPSAGGGAVEPPQVDYRWAQKSVSSKFDPEGDFKGTSQFDLAERISKGERPEVRYVERPGDDGRPVRLIVNSRTASSYAIAGIEPKDWRVSDVTDVVAPSRGGGTYSDHISDRLRSNRLSDSGTARVRLNDAASGEQLATVFVPD